MRCRWPWVLIAAVLLHVGSAAAGEDELAGGGAAPAVSPAATAPEEPGTQEALESLGEPRDASQRRQAQVERGGLLVGGGKSELEYRLSYAHFASNTIFIEGVAILPVIVIGEVAVERLRRDILIGSFAWRRGLRDDLQIELRVPVRYQHERLAIPEATPPREITESDAGLGDISAAIYYQLPRPAMGHYLIAGLQVKSRTGRDIFETTRVQMVGDVPVIVQDGLPMGTGFWSVRGVLTGLRASDPAALFWNLGYAESLSRDDLTIYARDIQTLDVVTRTVTVSPGSTLDYGFGLAYALNPSLSLSAQFQQAFTRSTYVRDAEQGEGAVAGSTLNVATLRLGAAQAHGPGASTDVSVSFGLTMDAPDLVIEIRRTIGG